MKISKTGGGVVVPSAYQPPPSSLLTAQPISVEYFYRAGMAAYAASSEHSKADFFLFPRWIQNIFMVFIDKVIDEKTVGLYYKYFIRNHKVSC